MKLAEFDFAKATWDTFRVFHVHVGGSSYSPLFVQFSSGEVIAHGRRWTPYHRTMYRSLNVRVFRSTDANLPELYLDPDKRIPITPSELYNKGSQLLLQDCDTGDVVRMDYDRGNAINKIPHHLQGSAAAYFPGPGQAPIGRSKIVLNRHYLMSQDDRALLRSLRNACKAWSMVLEIDPVCERWNKVIKGGGAAWRGTHAEFVPNLIGKQFADLTDEQRVRILTCGVTCQNALRGTTERLYTQPTP